MLYHLNNLRSIYQSHQRPSVQSPINTFASQEGIPPPKEEVTSYELKPGRKQVTRSVEHIDERLLRDVFMVPNFVRVRCYCNIGTNEEYIVD